MNIVMDRRLEKFSGVFSESDSIRSKKGLDQHGLKQLVLFNISYLPENIVFVHPEVPQNLYHLHVDSISK